MHHENPAPPNCVGDSDRAGHRWNVLSWRVVRIVTAIGLLVLLATQVDLARAIQALAGVSWQLLAAVLALILVARVLAAYRWYALLKQMDSAIAFGNIVRLVFVSGFVGYFLPGTLGIEALRIYGFARATGNAALAVTSVAVDRVLGMFALILLALGGLPFLPDALPSEVAYAGWVGLALLTAAVAAALQPRLRPLALRLLGSFQLVQDVLRKAFGMLDAYRTRPWALLWNAVVALGFHLLRCAAVGIGAAAFGVELPVAVYVAVTPLITILARIPISIAGLGIQEAGFVYLYGLFGMPPEVALLLSLVIRACTILSAAPGAWFYMVRGIRA